MSPPATFRQSHLRRFANCPLAASFDLFDFRGFDTEPAALGTMTHRVVVEIIRTLWRTGNDMISTEEAMVILREVCAQADVPSAQILVLGEESIRRLVGMVLTFCARPWQMRRLMAVEQRLHVDVQCADGQVRRLTGQPDVLMADPPDAVVIIDFKTSMARTREPRDGNYTKENGRPYITDEGNFQLSNYGWLVMRNYPSVQRAILREHNLRWDTTREAVIYRSDLEHVEPYMASLAQLMDRGVREGSGSGVWRPKPGAHCSYCPRPSACPVPSEARGNAAIQDDAMAEQYAKEMVTSERVREHRRAALKAWHEKTGRPIPIDDKEIRWKDKASGKGRDFGMFDPETQAERDARSAADQAVVAQMEAELARRTAEAAA